MTDEMMTMPLIKRPTSVALRGRDVQHKTSNSTYRYGIRVCLVSDADQGILYSFGRSVTQVRLGIRHRPSITIRTPPLTRILFCRRDRTTSSKKNLFFENCSARKKRICTISKYIIEQRFISFVQHPKPTGTIVYCAC
jgi:hypothetical protein